MTQSADALPGDPLRDEDLNGILRDVPTIEGCKQLGPYRLTRRLGRGGMGAVYLADHETLGKSLFAVKCLIIQHDDMTEEMVGRFQREARLAASVKSDRLVRVSDLQSAFGLHYMAMEFVAGEDLGKLIKKQEKLASARALNIARKIAEGLAAAHANEPCIVHRDIKPANVMITGDDDVKITDLGIARLIEGKSSELTATNSLLGTANYMAPEQVTSTHSVLPSADVYAVGTTLFQMLTGMRPFSEETNVYNVLKKVEQGLPDIGKVRPDLEASVKRLLKDITQRDPKRRPQDGRALMARIDQALDELAREAPVNDGDTLTGPRPDGGGGKLVKVIAGLLVVGGLAFGAQAAGLFGGEDTGGGHVVPGEGGTDSSDGEKDGEDESGSSNGGTDSGEDSGDSGSGKDTGGGTTPVPPKVRRFEPKQTWRQMAESLGTFLGQEEKLLEESVLGECAAELRKFFTGRRAELPGMAGDDERVVRTNFAKAKDAANADLQQVATDVLEELDKEPVVGPNPLEIAVDQLRNASSWPAVAAGLTTVLAMDGADEYAVVDSVSKALDAHYVESGGELCKLGAEAAGVRTAFGAAAEVDQLEDVSQRVVERIDGPGDWQAFADGVLSIDLVGPAQPAAVGARRVSVKDRLGESSERLAELGKRSTLRATLADLSDSQGPRIADAIRRLRWAGVSVPDGLPREEVRWPGVSKPSNPLSALRSPEGVDLAGAQRAVFGATADQLRYRSGKDVLKSICDDSAIERMPSDALACVFVAAWNAAHADARSEMAKHALEQAARNGCPKLAALLVRSGADPRRDVGEGETILNLAVKLEGLARPEQLQGAEAQAAQKALDRHVAVLDAIVGAHESPRDLLLHKSKVGAKDRILLGWAIRKSAQPIPAVKAIVSLHEAQGMPLSETEAPMSVGSVATLGALFRTEMGAENARSGAAIGAEHAEILAALVRYEETLPGLSNLVQDVRRALLDDLARRVRREDQSGDYLTAIRSPFDR